MIAGAISRVDEPWGDLGMTSSKWLGVPVELVRAADLTVTQDGVYFRHLLSAAPPHGGDPYPHVIVHKGARYLQDGHHRLVRYALAGVTEFLARVLVVDEAAA